MFKTTLSLVYFYIFYLMPKDQVFLRCHQNIYMCKCNSKALVAVAYIYIDNARAATSPTSS